MTPPSSGAITVSLGLVDQSVSIGYEALVDGAFHSRRAVVCICNVDDLPVKEKIKLFYLLPTNPVRFHVMEKLL